MSSIQALASAPSSQLNRLIRVPSTLRMMQVVIVVMSLVVGLVGLMTWHAFHSMVQTIGYDSAPSVVAAENIRGTLSDAHTDLVKVFVSGEGPNGKHISDTRAAINLANDYLVTASQNITYGDAERRPILRALDNLSLYETLIGAAEADGGNVYDIRAADDLVREHIIPAVDDLALANLTHLNLAYQSGQDSARGWLAVFCAAVVLLLVVLLYVQRYLLSTFRRYLNPLLVGGTVVMIVCALGFWLSSAGLLSDIRRAKEDAFDSVLALSQAKALAYNAHSEENIYLLVRDKDEKAEPEGVFWKSANQLMPQSIVSIDQLPPSLTPPKGNGLLTDELANITFPGEEAAARNTVAAWLDYLHADRQIRDLESHGDHKGAVDLSMGTHPRDSEGAFARFVAALDQTTAINQSQFDSAIARASGKARLLWIFLIPVLLAPIVGSVLGIEKRLAEFRE